MGLPVAVVSAIDAVLDGIQNRLTRTFPAGDPHNPVQADIALPAARLAISVDRLVWLERWTRPATAAELDAIKTLRDKAGLPARVVSAINALLDGIENASTYSTMIELNAVEPAWRPRPTQASLPASLRDVLLVGDSVVSFQGLMTRKEAATLTALPNLALPDKRQVVRLFNKSLNGGLGGGTLEIGARRGSAQPKRAPIVASLPFP